MTILETKNLKKYYGKGDTQVKALDGVNLSVEDGGARSHRGHQRLRQSTLPYDGSLDRPTSGSVTVDGKNTFSLKDEALHQFFAAEKLVLYFKVLTWCRC